MTVGEIVTRVRSAIDELMENDSDFLRETADEKNLTRTIVDKIGYALQHIFENAPTDKLGDDVFETLTAEELTGFSVDATSLVARLRLPKDLLRIVEARLSSWSHFPTPESDRSQVYLMQQDEYARGSWDRPVNILTYQGADRYLEMYCARAASDTLNFTFIRKPKTVSYDSDEDLETEVNVPSRLEASLIYQVAALTMVAFREDIAGNLFAIAARYLDPEQNRTEE